MRITMTLIVGLALFLICKNAIGQDTTSVYNKLYNLPDRFFHSINSKAEKIQSRLNRQTEKYLDRLARQELRLQKKLAKKDSLVAKQMFGEVKEKYARLRDHLQNKTKALNNLNGIYSGHLDSLKATL